MRSYERWKHRWRAGTGYPAGWLEALAHLQGALVAGERIHPGDEGTGMAHDSPRLDNLLSCEELKIVIQNAEDLLFAKKMADLIKNNGKIKPQLFLQAGWENEEGQTLAIKFVKNNPDWRLSMQTHKWLGVL